MDLRRGRRGGEYDQSSLYETLKELKKINSKPSVLGKHSVTKLYPTPAESFENTI